MRRGPKREALRAISRLVDDVSSRPPFFGVQAIIRLSEIISTFNELLLTNSGHAQGLQNAGRLRLTPATRKKGTACLLAQDSTPAARSSRLFPPPWDWSSAAPAHGPATVRPRPAQALLGKPYTEALRRNAQAVSHASLVQALRRGDATTAEFRGDRLDIIIDLKTSAVIALSCG